LRADGGYRPRDDMSESISSRAVCYRCFRPKGHCLCDAIVAVDNRVPVVILQHPRERTHPFGTARLAELGLARVEVLVDHLGRLRRDATPLGPLAGAALLYPASDARDVTTLGPDEIPKRLIVIDGTWHHARTLYRDIPALAALPHLTLPGHLRSAFRIRRQPDVFCLSTIEAVVYALRALEPGTPGLETLLDSFSLMQRRQLAVPRGAGRTRKRTRARESRAIPRRLVEEYESLVVAYAESTLDPASPRGRRLLGCVAVKPATGERFHRFVRHPGLSEAHLAHLGLTRECVEGGVTDEEFGRDWASFLGAAENLAAWNHGTLELLCRAAGAAPAGVSLKAAYHNLKRFRGSLDDVVRLEGLGSAPAPSEWGRAGDRLESALRLAQFLRLRAVERRLDPRSERADADWQAEAPESGPRSSPIQ
jgi:DTW domain-containing protein